MNLLEHNEPNEVANIHKFNLDNHLIFLHWCYLLTNGKFKVLFDQGPWNLVDYSLEHTKITVSFNCWLEPKELVAEHIILNIHQMFFYRSMRGLRFCLIKVQEIWLVVHIIQKRSPSHLPIHLNTMNLVGYLLLINSIWTSISCSHINVKLLINGGVYGYVWSRSKKSKVLFIWTQWIQYFIWLLIWT
jgi:hypothetical protein